MFETELIKIPKGEFVIGSTRKSVEELITRFPGTERKLLEREMPQHKLYFSEYYIGKYPVIVKEFAVFVNKTGYVTTAEKNKSGFVFNPGFAEVEGADWRHPLGKESDITILCHESLSGGRQYKKQDQDKCIYPFHNINQPILYI